MNHQDYLNEKKKRDRKLFALRKKNPTKWSFSALGEKFEISRQRAEQICKRMEEK